MRPVTWYTNNQASAVSDQQARSLESSDVANPTSLLSGKRSSRVEYYVATAPTSANSNVLDSGLEPGRLGPIKPTNFGSAAQVAARSFLAKERGEARYAALCLPRESAPNWCAHSPQHQQLRLSEPTAIITKPTVDNERHGDRMEID